MIYWKLKNLIIWDSEPYDATSTAEGFLTLWHIGDWK